MTNIVGIEFKAFVIFWFCTDLSQRDLLMDAGGLEMADDGECHRCFVLSYRL